MTPELLVGRGHQEGCDELQLLLVNPPVAPASHRSSCRGEVKRIVAGVL
jgi:hypothetical protein